MSVSNCNECEFTTNCNSYFGGLGCKQREDIYKQAETKKQNDIRKKKRAKMKKKIAEGGVAVVLVILLLVVAYGVSWIATCGIIKLITMCFGLTFKWSVATGIWLIMCLLQSVFKVTVNNKR